MAAQRPASTPASVTPTEAEVNDTGDVATADPALAASDSTSDVTSPAAEPVVAEPVAAEPVAAEPVAVAQAPAQQVVYVQAPKPFVAKGNRLFGVLIAILSTIVFLVVYAVAFVLTQAADSQPIDFSFISTTDFYAPGLIFLVAFVLLVLIVNRGGWPAHILGSIFVGIAVFFGGTGLLLLINISQIPSNQVSQAFHTALFSPGVILAALLAREVSLWMGFFISARGRRVKARNVEGRVLYDNEIAAKRAEYEQVNAAAGVPGVTAPRSFASTGEISRTGQVEPVTAEPVESASGEVAAP